MNDLQRIAITTACRDCDSIPKVSGAGNVTSGPEGRVQLMHNGVRVFTDSHYGGYNTEVIRRLRGHHEPQEERAFFEVLKQVGPGGTMLELGSFWAYYSLWFLSAVPQGRAFMVEPLDEAMEWGTKNFALNAKQGTFLLAAIDETESQESAVELWPGKTVVVPTTTVDQLMSRFQLQRLDVLHADIQGAEVRMLKGARKALSNRTIEWLFISTHGENIHQKCKRLLRENGYSILADHTPAESFSVDGLIVASAKRRRSIPISKRVSWASLTAKMRATLRVHLLEPLRMRPKTG